VTPRSRTVDEIDPANVTCSLLSWCCKTPVSRTPHEVCLRQVQLGQLTPSITRCLPCRQLGVVQHHERHVVWLTDTAVSHRRKSVSSPRVYSLHHRGRQCMGQTGVDPTPILEGLHTAYGGSRTQYTQFVPCDSGLTGGTS